MPFDFSAAVSAPFRMRPGLRRLAPEVQQLTPLQPGCQHQREKLAVLSAFAHQALLRCERFDATPALHALAQLAAQEHPDVWAWDGTRAQALGLGLAVVDGQVEQLAQGSFGTGQELFVCLQNLEPDWRLAGLLSLAFAQDFAVIDGQSGAVPFMAVCLPSFWAPEEKAGHHFAEIHAPVADNQLLIEASAALMSVVTRGNRWERFVWTITPHPHLHAHPMRVAPERWQGVDLAALGSQAYWRTEHQTFLPLPSRQQAVFTIHVELTPLARALAAPQHAAQVHDALASMSPAVLAYRGLTDVQAPLLRWLASR